MTQPERILITGGAGFIGSHLAEVLLDRGCEVTIIDDLSTGKFDNIAHLVERSKFHFAIDTILNESVLDRLVSNCQIIYHMAAAVGVMLIVDHPVHTIETNIRGTEAVLKTALRYRAKVLVASSSEVYGKGNRVPFRENDDVVIGPTERSRWSYSASKMIDEFLALAYYREKGLPVVVFRLFNTIGDRQTGQYGMVIPRFIHQVVKGEKLSVYGDGTQSRCFLNVKDAVNAIILLASIKEAEGQVFNVGSMEEISITNLARLILEIINYSDDSHPSMGNISQTALDDIEYIPYESAYAVGFEDMLRRVPDISKIKQLTGWEPHYTLRDTLAELIKDEKTAINR